MSIADGYAAPMDLKTTVFFYAALEGLGSVEVENEASSLGYDDTVTLKGITPDLGEFIVDITRGPESNSHPVHSHPSYGDKPLDRTIVHSLSEEAGSLWQAKGMSGHSRSCDPRNTKTEQGSRSFVCGHEKRG
jgi:mannosyl-oligosaccharide glucosidase